MPAPKYALFLCSGRRGEELFWALVSYPFSEDTKKRLPSLAAEQSSKSGIRLLQLLNAYVTDLQAITVTQETDTALLVEETWVVQVVNSVWVVTLTVW